MGAGKGKTLNAINAAIEFEGKVLFLSFEESVEMVSHRIEYLGGEHALDKIFVVNFKDEPTFDVESFVDNNKIGLVIIDSGVGVVDDALYALASKMYHNRPELSVITTQRTSSSKS